MKKNLLVFISLVLFVTTGMAQNPEENTIIKNGYEVHFNAFSTDFLTKEVAKTYQIGRSKTKGMVNISVLKQNDNAVATPVEANISIRAENLYGQKKSISLRKINENDEAIYYIGTFPVSSRETINFNANVLASGSKSPIEVKFSQQFYTD